jgi:prepilin signal peptidase PulO-like enzyme (type II secretory pathway)
MAYQIFLNLFIFILGLTVGSFLNAVIFRLEKGESVVFDKKRLRSSTSLKKLNSSPTSPLNNLARSYCPHCRHTLAWYDLLPVLSFFILRGRCRYCGKKISIQYPIVEIATGILFVLIFLKISNSQLLTSNLIPNSQFPIPNFQLLIINYQLLISLIFWFYIASVLMVIFVYDYKYYLIPDKILFPAIAVACIWYFVSSAAIQDTKYYLLNIFGAGLLSAIVASGFFLSLVLVSRGRWMGLGDVKLAFLMGLILGWPNIFVALFLAFALGAIVGLALIALGRLRLQKPFKRLLKPNNGYSLKSEIPFGPFLIIGTFIALFWGSQIVSWYLGMLL